MRRTLAVSAVLAAVLLSACGNEPGDGTPDPSPKVSASPTETSPSPEPSSEPSGEPSTGTDPTATIAPEDVTAEQKQACVDGMITQIREKRNDGVPPACAILPRDVVVALIQEALSGG